MKKNILAAVAAITLLGGCTRSTQYGECIGVLGKETPDMRYDYSVKNAILGVIFSETIIVPAIVIFDDVKCPQGPYLKK
jgi:hypothetical protein